METYHLNPEEQRITEDFYWAEEAPEVQQHEGKLVVVYHKRVIAVGTDQSALLAEAAAKERCQPEDLVVVLVPRLDMEEIPH